MEDFVCNLHPYSACLQYMEDTGRSKMRQDFGVLGFQDSISRVRIAPRGISHGIPHDNDMVG